MAVFHVSQLPGDDGSVCGDIYLCSTVLCDGQLVCLVRHPADCDDLCYSDVSGAAAVDVVLEGLETDEAAGDAVGYLAGI